MLRSLGVPNTARAYSWTVAGVGNARARLELDSYPAGTLVHGGEGGRNWLAWGRLNIRAWTEPLRSIGAPAREVAGRPEVKPVIG